MKQPITKHEIEALQQKEVTVKLVDIRTTEEFEKKHIPGAVNMPAETLENSVKHFNAGDTIVCICNKGQERSQQAAETIASMGFTNVFYLEAGTFGWPEPSSTKEA